MATKTNIKKDPSLKTLVIKGVFISIIISSILLIIEKKQVFGEDNTNNQIDWKWDWFYRLDKSKTPIDVLFVGNSHILTGMNPYLFTRQTGLNSFILGAPGVGVHDLYYTIEEAIQVKKPQVIVLETYAINNMEPRDLSAGALNDQITSFRARKNFSLKMKSMFSLFNYNNYLITWFDVFKNHNFIFTKPDQISRNIKNGGPERKEKKDVYLGQFSRFQSGLTQKTLDRYTKEGAPVDGNEYTISESAIKYTKKIAALCDTNNIQLVFLTIPMYANHVANYDVWREVLETHIGDLTTHWLDLQIDGSPEQYNVNAFEDTYDANQHLTGYGMNVTAVVFAKYIKENFPDIPTRYEEEKWQRFIAKFPK